MSIYNNGIFYFLFFEFWYKINVKIILYFDFCEN